MLGFDLRAGSRSNREARESVFAKTKFHAPLGPQARDAESARACDGNNSARHARQYNAEPPLVDGFICGIDSPRLFACARGIAGR
jgi:hypothetical protein